MKKVLIITYYWPPSGGAGVQRWLKFVKYLGGFGWEPIIYTPENPEPPDYDNSLQNDVPERITVIRKPVWEPYNLYKKLTGKKRESRITHGFLKEEKNQSLFEKLSVWIRGNFFIPDARRFWIKPSTRFLHNYLQTNPVDALISSGPPHSMHLIALAIKKKLNIPWIADFRDPWTEIDFYGQLRLTPWADEKHKKLERKVLTTADIVVTIGRHLAKRLRKLGARRVEVITNGYDKDDFLFSPVELEKLFTLTHIGSVNKDRNPETLWQAIAGLCAENAEIDEHLRLRFVGKVDYSLKASLDKFGLKDRTEIIPYIPHHDALKLAASSAVLLLLINNTPNQQGIVTGKLFEYLATHRPVLCIGPDDGEAAEIIASCESGRSFCYNESEKAAKWVLDLYKQWSMGSKLIVGNDHIGDYSRQKQTQKLGHILKSQLKTPEVPKT